MVTAAVLGATVGTALALVITLTMLIYRYYARKYDDWSSWERRLPTTSVFKSGNSDRTRLNSRIPKPTYLPLIQQVGDIFRLINMINKQKVTQK